MKWGVTAAQPQRAWHAGLGILTSLAIIHAASGTNPSTPCDPSPCAKGDLYFGSTSQACDNLGGDLVGVRCFKHFQSTGLTSTRQNGEDDCMAWTSGTNWTMQHLAHLAKITSACQNSKVQSLMDDDEAWIGVSDLVDEGIYRFPDGTGVTYANWQSGEPNNDGAGEDCVQIQRSNSLWKDTSCNLYVPRFVCSFDVPDRIAQCTTCPPGTYKSQSDAVLGNQVCLPCEVGFYCEGNTSRVECPEQTASPSRSGLRANCTCIAGYTGTNGGPCSACAAGKFKNVAGSASCLSCQSGKYSDFAATGCTDCPTRSHSNSGSSRAGCVCNAGYTGPNGGGSCNACSPGSYKVQNGSTSCTACDAGKYSANSAAGLAMDTCTSCPNHTQSVSGSSVQAACQCNTGFYGANGGPCIACPANSVKETVGTAPCLCNEGFTGPVNSPCLACEKGKYKDTVGDSVCLLCGAGKYNQILAAESALQCLDCPSNSWSTTQSESILNCTCSPGWTGPNGQPCTGCGPGTYKGSIGSAPCTTCEAGKFNPFTSSSDCSFCPLRSDAPAGSTSITMCKCYKGYTGGDGQNCQPCPVGTYKDTNGSTPCSTCPSFTLSTAGTANVEHTSCVCGPGYIGFGAKDCTACPAGTYKNKTGPEFPCVSCPVGKFSGSEAVTHCTDCPSNSEAPAGSTTISQCICSEGFQGLQCLIESFPFEVPPGSPISEVAVSVTLGLSASQFAAARGAILSNTAEFLGLQPDQVSVEAARRRRRILQTRTTQALFVLLVPQVMASHVERQMSSSAFTQFLVLTLNQDADLLAELLSLAADSSSPAPASDGEDVSTATVSAISASGFLVLNGISVSCGNGRFPLGSDCAECPTGFFKRATDNSSCLSCPNLHTTLALGAFQSDHCVCRNGTFEDTVKPGVCQTCPAGIYCTAGQEPLECPNTMTSPANSSTVHDCVCAPGHYRNSTESECSPCEPGYYCLGDTHRERCPLEASSPAESGSAAACEDLLEKELNETIAFAAGTASTVATAVGAIVGANVAMAVGSSVGASVAATAAGGATGAVAGAAGGGAGASTSAAGAGGGGAAMALIGQVQFMTMLGSVGGNSNSSPALAEFSGGFGWATLNFDLGVTLGGQEDMMNDTNATNASSSSSSPIVRRVLGMALTRAARRSNSSDTENQTSSDRECNLATGDALVQKLLVVFGTFMSTTAMRMAIAYAMFRYSGEHHAEFAFPAWEGPVVLAQYYPVCETAAQTLASKCVPWVLLSVLVIALGPFMFLAWSFISVRRAVKLGDLEYTDPAKVNWKKFREDFKAVPWYKPHMRYFLLKTTWKEYTEAGSWKANKPYASKYLFLFSGYHKFAYLFFAWLFLLKIVRPLVLFNFDGPRNAMAMLCLEVLDWLALIVARPSAAFLQNIKAPVNNFLNLFSITAVSLPQIMGYNPLGDAFSDLMTIYMATASAALLGIGAMLGPVLQIYNNLHRIWGYLMLLKSKLGQILAPFAKMLKPVWEVLVATGCAAGLITLQRKMQHKFRLWLKHHVKGRLKPYMVMLGLDEDSEAYDSEDEGEEPGAKGVEGKGTGNTATGLDADVKTAAAAAGLGIGVAAVATAPNKAGIQTSTQQPVHGANGWPGMETADISAHPQARNPHLAIGETVYRSTAPATAHPFDYLGASDQFRQDKSKFQVGGVQMVVSSVYDESGRLQDQHKLPTPFVNKGHPFVEAVSSDITDRSPQYRTQPGLFGTPGNQFVTVEVPLQDSTEQKGWQRSTDPIWSANSEHKSSTSGRPLILSPPQAPKEIYNAPPWLSREQPTFRGPLVTQIEAPEGQNPLFPQGHENPQTATAVNRSRTSGRVPDQEARVQARRRSLVVPPLSPPAAQMLPQNAATQDLFVSPPPLPASPERSKETTPERQRPLLIETGLEDEVQFNNSRRSSMIALNNTFHAKTQTPSPTVPEAARAKTHSPQVTAEFVHSPVAAARRDSLQLDMMLLRAQALSPRQSYGMMMPSLVHPSMSRRPSTRLVESDLETRILSC